MEVAWHPLAVPGLVCIVLGWSLAAVVFATRPDRAQNRRLALLLAVQSSCIGSFTALRVLLPDARDAFGAYAVYTTLVLLFPLLNLRFLATLDTPIVKPLRTRTAFVVIVAWSLVAEAVWFLAPERMVSGMGWQADVGYWFVDITPLNRIIIQGLNMLVFLFSLLVAIFAYARAASRTAKQQARSYAIAFGVRDGLIVLYIVLVNALDYHTAPGAVVMLTMLPIIDVLLAMLLAYGILKSQLFDIDLHVKWGLKQSTVAAVFVGVFVVVSAIAEQFVQERLGAVLGLAGVVLLALAFFPLQRLAERVSNAAMPRVAKTDEYLTLRKLEVYRAAVEGSYADGLVTRHERDILDRLREQLAISEDEASAVERDVAARFAAA